MSPVLSTYAGASARAFGWGYSLAVPSDFELIETQTVGAGGAASVTFGSGGTIPQTYKHLQIRGIGKSLASSTQDLRFQFNGDTATNYSIHYLLGNGTIASSNSSASTAFIRNNSSVVSSSVTSVFGTVIIDILDYANTSKYKTTRHLGSYEDNTGGQAVLDSGSWRSTSAITSILLYPSSGSFGQYTTYSLYGMK